MLKLMAIACPLHCVVAAADKQATRDRLPEVVRSRTDHSGEALLRHSGGVTAPVMHDTSRNTSVAPYHYDALQQLDCLLPQDTHNTHACSSPH